MIQTCRAGERKPDGGRDEKTGLSLRWGIKGLRFKKNKNKKVVGKSDHEMMENWNKLYEIGSESKVSKIKNTKKKNYYKKWYYNLLADYY